MIEAERESELAAFHEEILKAVSDPENFRHFREQKHSASEPMGGEEKEAIRSSLHELDDIEMDFWNTIKGIAFAKKQPSSTELRAFMAQLNEHKVAFRDKKFVKAYCDWLLNLLSTIFNYVDLLEGGDQTVAEDLNTAKKELRNRILV